MKKTCLEAMEGPPGSRAKSAGFTFFRNFRKWLKWVPEEDAESFRSRLPFPTQVIPPDEARSILKETYSNAAR